MINYAKVVGCRPVARFLGLVGGHTYWLGYIHYAKVVGCRPV